MPASSSQTSFHSLKTHEATGVPFAQADANAGTSKTGQLMPGAAQPAGLPSTSKESSAQVPFRTSSHFRGTTCLASERNSGGRLSSAEQPPRADVSRTASDGTKRAMRIQNPGMSAMLSFVKKKSAIKIEIETTTTVRVVLFPTPSVPPRVFIPK